MERMSTIDMIFVSSCLAGKKCRYDGKDCAVPSIKKLLKEGKAVDLCPEEAGGLPIPRLPSEIIRDKVVSKAGKDVTAEYERGAQAALKLFQQYHCSYAVLKEKSPSCGCQWIYDGSFSGKLIPGEGITTQLFRKNGITVINEMEWEKKDNERL